MDIEELSKSQVILLTLLVSFVTSIATGIVTVSLMDQAPPVVAQTVNRVIERTVETVAPSVNGQGAAAVVTQQKTVVVKESDLISQAVQRVEPSLVRLYSRDRENEQFLGLGIVLDASGRIVTDATALGDRADAFAALSDGTRVRVFVSAREESTGLAFMQATSSEKMPAFKPAALMAGRAVLGQSLVSIAGKSVSRIAPGIVTGMNTEKVAGFETSIGTGDIIAGSPVIDTDGEIVGVSTGVSRASSPSGFIAASALIASDE